MVRAWVGTAARLLLAVVWLAAGAAKVGDLAASGRAVHAYQLTPYELSTAIGAALPFVELTLGVLLLLGFATRTVSAISAGLLLVFVAGVASAWARGLTIDCGCFGGGGELAAGVDPGYGLEIARSASLALVSIWLVISPVTKLSVDSWLGIGGPLRRGDE